MVTGGRTYANAARVALVLASLKPTLIVPGGARGADSLCGTWATANGIPTQVFHPDWDTYGKRAGFLRNAEMLDTSKPDFVVAFPGGNGTANMVRYALCKGYRVLPVID